VGINIAKLPEIFLGSGALYAPTKCPNLNKSSRIL